MDDLIVGIAMVLVIEGVFYALFPGQMRKMVQDMTKMPDTFLRNAGLVAVLAGVFIVWLVRG